VLPEYPLDREIIQEGDYYREASSEDIRFNHAVFTVIPVNYQFSNPLYYEILAEI
jgi:hypothetical protein